GGEVGPDRRIDGRHLRLGPGPEGDPEQAEQAEEPQPGTRDRADRGAETKPAETAPQRQASFSSCTRASPSEDALFLPARDTEMGNNRAEMQVGGQASPVPAATRRAAIPQGVAPSPEIA